MAVNLDQTPKKIEDAVRKNPANQGLNEFEMWQAIDAAIAAAAATINPVTSYKSGNIGDTHGRK